MCPFADQSRSCIVNASLLTNGVHLREISNLFECWLKCMESGECIVFHWNKDSKTCTLSTKYSNVCEISNGPLTVFKKECFNQDGFTNMSCKSADYHIETSNGLQFLWDRKQTVKELEKCENENISPNEIDELSSMMVYRTSSSMGCQEECSLG